MNTSPSCPFDCPSWNSSVFASFKRQQCSDGLQDQIWQSIPGDSCTRLCSQENLCTLTPTLTLRRRTFRSTPGEMVSDSLVQPFQMVSIITKLLEIKHFVLTADIVVVSFMIWRDLTMERHWKSRGNYATSFKSVKPCYDYIISASTGSVKYRRRLRRVHDGRVNNNGSEAHFPPST